MGFSYDFNILHQSVVGLDCGEIEGYPAKFKKFSSAAELAAQSSALPWFSGVSCAARLRSRRLDKTGFSIRNWLSAIRIPKSGDKKISRQHPLMSSSSIL